MFFSFSRVLVIFLCLNPLCILFSGFMLSLLWLFLECKIDWFIASIRCGNRGGKAFDVGGSCHPLPLCKTAQVYLWSVMYQFRHTSYSDLFKIFYFYCLFYLMLFETQVGRVPVLCFFCVVFFSKWVTTYWSNHHVVIETHYPTDKISQCGCHTGWKQVS